MNHAWLRARARDEGDDFDGVYCALCETRQGSVDDWRDDDGSLPWFITDDVYICKRCEAEAEAEVVAMVFESGVKH